MALTSTSLIHKIQQNTLLFPFIFLGPPLKPPMFIAYAHYMSNGYCTIMVNPVNRKKFCKPINFFSSPDAEYNGVKTGTYRANNALWITNNRFALMEVGDESIKCPGAGQGGYFYDRDFMNWIIRQDYSGFQDLSGLFHNEPKWSSGWIRSEYFVHKSSRSIYYQTKKSVNDHNSFQIFQENGIQPFLIFRKQKKWWIFFYYGSIFLLRNAISNLCCFRFFAFPISKSKAKYWKLVMQLSETLRINNHHLGNLQFLFFAHSCYLAVRAGKGRERETKNRGLFYLHIHDHEQLYKTSFPCIKSKGRT